MNIVYFFALFALVPSHMLCHNHFHSSNSGKDKLKRQGYKMEIQKAWGHIAVMIIKNEAMCTRHFDYSYPFARIEGALERLLS